VVNVFQHQLVGLGEEAVDYWYPAEAKDCKDNERVPLRYVNKYTVHGWVLVFEKEGQHTLILSIAMGVICTTVKTHIQLTNPPRACPRDRIRVVVTSLG